jgi:hypothetical protein
MQKFLLPNPSQNFDCKTSPVIVAHQDAARKLRSRGVLIQSLLTVGYIYLNVSK